MNKSIKILAMLANIVLPTLVGFALVGCITTYSDPIDAENLTSIKNKKIIVEYPDEITMLRHDISVSAFGIIGALAADSAAKSRGVKIIEAYNVESDMSDEIGQEIANCLVMNYELEFTEVPSDVENTNQINNANTLWLDVWVVEWHTSLVTVEIIDDQGQAQDANDYEFKYVIEAVLKDLDERKTIARGRFNWDSTKDEGLEEKYLFLEEEDGISVGNNNSELRFKQQMARAKEQAIRFFQDEIFCQQPQDIGIELPDTLGYVEPVDNNIE